MWRSIRVFITHSVGLEKKTRGRVHLQARQSKNGKFFSTRNKPLKPFFLLKTCKYRDWTVFLIESGLNFKNLSQGIWTPHSAIWSLGVRGSHLHFQWRMTGRCQGISDLTGYPSADIWIILISTYPNSCVLLLIQFPISCRLRQKKSGWGLFFLSQFYLFFLSFLVLHLTTPKLPSL